MSEDAVERFRAALDLADLAEEIMRANLRRRHPAATAEEIEDLLTHWYAQRPGAEHGDGEGIPIDLSKWQ